MQRGICRPTELGALVDIRLLLAVTLTFAIIPNGIRLFVWGAPALSTIKLRVCQMSMNEDNPIEWQVVVYITAGRKVSPCMHGQLESHAKRGADCSVGLIQVQVSGVWPV